VDVRVIAASNRDLRSLVNEGRFREDLMHRLDLFRVFIPPLRERRDDVVPLVEALMRRACRRHRLDPRPITPEGTRRLEAYAWPGNVRELAHELERALIFEDGPLTFSQLRAQNEVPSAAANSSGDADWLNPGFRFPPVGFSLEEANDRLVHHAMEQSGGNISAAARLLGVSRDVVRYRLTGRARRTGEGSTPAGAPGP
jgi:DNA-binding NtrC family response regulator